MPVKIIPSKVILGLLLGLLVLIVIAFLVTQREWLSNIKAKPRAIASLRRSIKEHELGVYNGLYGYAGAGT